MPGAVEPEAPFENEAMGCRDVFPRSTQDEVGWVLALYGREVRFARYWIEAAGQPLGATLLGGAARARAPRDRCISERFLRWLADPRFTGDLDILSRPTTPGILRQLHANPRLGCRPVSVA